MRKENSLLSINHVAEMLGVSKRTVASYKAKGLLPYYQVGRVLRFKLEDVQNHIAENTISGKSIKKEVSHE